ncbi:MAG: MlaA family lipoprotein [Halocynthiibacter sp.]
MSVLPHFIKAGMLASVLGVMGCAAPERTGGISDPNEARNRDIYKGFQDVDSGFYAPASNGYGTAIPRPIRRGVSNFSANVSLPGSIVNNLLQADFKGAADNTLRFVVNTTFGIGGLFDPAGGGGVHAKTADFGQTLGKWGVPEGDYVVLPFIGPSTERDAFGKVVDIFTNPLSTQVEGVERAYVVTSSIFSYADYRYEQAELINALLYESEDSYAQARSLYLQKRRHAVGLDVTDEEADEIDALFEELYND